MSEDVEVVWEEDGLDDHPHREHPIAEDGAVYSKQRRAKAVKKEEESVEIGYGCNQSYG